MKEEYGEIYLGFYNFCLEIIYVVVGEFLLVKIRYLVFFNVVGIGKYNRFIVRGSKYLRIIMLSITVFSKCLLINDFV